MFCWHKWTAWDKGDIISVYSAMANELCKTLKDMPIRCELVQKRRCIKCNKINYRKEVV